MVSGVTNHACPSAYLMDESGFAVARRTVIVCLHCAKCKFGGGGITVWACFSVGFGPLVPMKEILIASAYRDILDKFMLPTIWEQLGDDPFLLQHDYISFKKQGL